MLSERVQRQIDRLLDLCEEAVGRKDWSLARENAQAVLDLDPDNADARGFFDAATRALSRGAPGSSNSGAHPVAAAAASAAAAPHPESFCDGRYQVIRFLGEGGKKRVFLAHDAKLDRDVAFALIKTDGLNAEGEARIRREAQAMGKLGDHRHIVPVYDIGEEAGQPYLVTQLMGGGDVEGLIEKAPDHRLPLDTTL